MTENIYYKKLSLPVQMIPHDYSVSTYSFKEVKMSLDHINKEVHDFLASLDMEAMVAEYFYTPLKFMYQLHLDIPTTNPRQYVKLNWVFGGADSEMKWYELKAGPLTEENFANMQKTSIGRVIPRFPIKDCNEVMRVNIQGPCLVNVSTIHTMQQGNIEPRHCYTFYLKDKRSTKERMDWDDAIERFKPYWSKDQ